MTSTPSPQQGIWTLTAPDGRTWQADSPLKAVSAEQRERVPAKVAVERIFAACEEAQPAVLAVPGWRPIESAPKDGTVIILGYLPNPRIDRHVYEGKWHELQGWWTSVNGFMVHNDATHWMPLPAAPAIHEGGEHA